MDGSNYTVERMHCGKNPLTIHLCLPKLTSGLTFVRSVIIGSEHPRKRIRQSGNETGVEHVLGMRLVLT